jgi:hypothetical protein
MTSKLDQSSNQDCREFLVVMGKSVQPSWLPPFNGTILFRIVTFTASSTGILRQNQQDLAIKSGMSAIVKHLPDPGFVMDHNIGLIGDSGQAP